jgi:hypothetical protein
MTAPPEAELRKWAVCPIKFEDLRSARYFGTREASIEFLNSVAVVAEWLPPLPTISVLDYPQDGSPRLHLNTSAFPIEVTAPPSLVLIENAPEWVAMKSDGLGFHHSTITHDELQPLSIVEIERRFTVPLPDDLVHGDMAIEYGTDLESELALAISLPDCCLSEDSLADEVEKIARQLPGNDLTRTRLSIREYLTAALIAYDDALVQIWPKLSGEAFAKWIGSYQFQRYLGRSCDRLTRAPVIRELVRTTDCAKSEIERVRCSLQTEIARYALALQSPKANNTLTRRRSGKPGKVTATSTRLDSFLAEVGRLADLRANIPFAVFYGAAGYTDITEFRKWRNEDPRITDGAKRKFDRLLNYGAASFLQYLTAH